jgi:hypothetical protein
MAVGSAVMTVKLDDFQLMVLEKQKTDCEDVVELLGELYDARVPRTLSGRLHTHLSDCPHCTELYTDFCKSASLADQRVDADLVPLSSIQSYRTARDVPAGVKKRLRQNLNARLGISLSLVD